jgi:riboflavin synthase
MFTGIITAVGTVRAARRDERGLELEIAAPYDDLALGESIAVDGACLTVQRRGDGWFEVHVVATSLDRTRFGACAPGKPVNLERALRAGDRLGGHIVQGHVDGVGTVVSRTPSEHWEVVEISLPAALSRYLVDKGSITVDGVSLTVVAAGADRFTVSLIPETLARTTLGLKRAGDPVNLEVDVIAKYVERLLGARGTHASGAPGSTTAADLLGTSAAQE